MTFRSTACLFAGLACALLSRSSLALQPTVTADNSPDNEPSVTAFVYGTTSPYSVQLHSDYTAGPTQFTVTGLATDDISSLTITGSTGGQAVSVLVFQRGGTPSTPIRTVNSITSTATGPAIVQSLAALDVGLIRVNRIGSAYVNGTVVGPVELIATSGSLHNNSITGQFGGGHLRGNIYVPAGSIHDLHFTAGSIGTPTEPVTITVGGDPALDNPHISIIQSPTIHAIVSGPNGSPLASLGRLVTSNSDITGTYNIQKFGFWNFGPGMFLFGPSARFTGTLVIHENFPESISGIPTSIELPASALAGQIIVNGANASHAWTGPVRIGTGAGQIILDNGSAQPNQAPYYTSASSTFGGGAVGLVPFKLHRADCSPPGRRPAL